MNRLALSTRAAIIRCLTDGMGIRATARTMQVSKGAVTRILEDSGQFAAIYSDLKLRGLRCPTLEFDEQWSFVHTKQSRAKQPEHGDIYTFAAFATESKLVVSWLVGDRSSESTDAFVEGVASRTVGRVQISTDGWQAYPDAISHYFGYTRADYAIVVKKYENDGDVEAQRRYGLARVKSMEKVRMIGTPDMETAGTSGVENMHLHVRQKCRRFARLTNMHSKDVQHHALAVSLNFFAHNFMRVHSGLNKINGKGITPAMMHDLADRPLSAEWLAEAITPESVTIK